MNPSPLTPFHFSDTLQVACPVGGIGAGCVCLNGIGGIVDFSIRNKPETTALPDTHSIGDAAFALLHIKGSKPVTRLVEGPLEPQKLYDQRLQAQGYRHGGHEGLPRFEKSSFSAGYPFALVELSDSSLPVSVDLLAFNPFVPLDAKNSGMPCAVFEYTVRNTSGKRVDFELSFHLSHPAKGAVGGWKGTRTKALKNRGVFFSNTENPSSETYGNACLLAPCGHAKVKGMWMRGGWFDAVSGIWREVSTGSFKENAGWNGVDVEGRNGGSIIFEGSLAPGKCATYPVILSWYFPNVHYACGQPEVDSPQDCSEEAIRAASTPAWHPYYAGVWRDARHVAEYAAARYDSLKLRTVAFNRALLSSTLPEVVMDAVSSNLAILKSPTVLRQKKGNIWAWEGCFTNRGCCYGTCTHVWNYAQALPHLFPDLERTIREQEFGQSMERSGHMNFRAALPDTAAKHLAHAAADGQLGCILKLYRDWQISGKTGWMKELYPLAKRSLEYCIDTWDPDRRGALFEPHHNTYDIEFWGPDGMCTSIYVAALSALAGMASTLGEKRDEGTYAELARRGARYMDEELFNGEYYHQVVQYKNLRDRSFLKQISDKNARRSELTALLAEEGPKYQYGTGCLSDGVIGAWMAEIYGVDTPMNRSKIRSTLNAIFRHNFRRDLSRHANCQRPGYALGKEAGLLLCSWPRGGKPTLPFVYSDEVWTGIEYQVASHLIEEGMVEEGVRVVKGVRSRYRGSARNPFNEYECGSYYARAMSSYALLGSLSGFRYSAVDQILHFSPRIRKLPFRVFFSTASAWGTITLDKQSLSVSVVEGKLALKEIRLGKAGKSIQQRVPRKIAAGQTARFRVGGASTRSKARVI